MHIGRWLELVEEIKSSFTVEDEGRVEADEPSGGYTDFLVFNGPLGRMKLEFITKPKVVDKKINYSKRIGSEVRVEYLYSPTEKIYQFLPYRWEESNQQWQPLDVNRFNL